MNIQTVADSTINQSLKAGAEKSMVSTSSTVAKEFNVESGRMTLLRTTFDQNLSLKTLIDQRQSLMSGNQFDSDAIATIVKNGVSSCKSSPQDPANGFAPAQGRREFSFGNNPPSEAWMHKRLVELLDETRERFPKIILESCTAKYVHTEKTMLTSEGTQLSAKQGHYEGFIMFTAKDGKQSSSFNYINFAIATSDVDKPISLIKFGGLEDLLQQSTELLHTRKIPAKFDGEVVITPHCLEDMLNSWHSYLGPNHMLKGNSFFKDKVGTKVASEKWNVVSQPVESSFASRMFWNPDGYIAKNETLFENGVLKTYLLSHYAAQKLGGTTSLSGGTYLHVYPGDKDVQELVGAVKKGILMCRYSAGMPAENGDISGVAKNSYYIEDGKIQYPLSETMVSGNLFRMLTDIQDLSKQTINCGSSELPWARIANINVS